VDFFKIRLSLKFSGGAFLFGESCGFENFFVCEMGWFSGLNLDLVATIVPKRIKTYRNNQKVKNVSRSRKKLHTDIEDF